MTQKLTDEKIERLYDATRATLLEWTDRLRAESAGEFPGEGNRVSSRDGGPRPLRPAVPAMRRARSSASAMPSNETNYCATCQTGGRLLADRALSRLLHEDWPRTLDELEALKKR